MTTAAQFWIHLEAEEKARKAQIEAVRIRATGNHLVAAQDEPEPEPRKPRVFVRARNLNQAEQEK